MVGAERDLCGSSSPTPLLKQGHLQQAAQDCVQVGLEYLQKKESTKSLGNLFQGCVTLRMKKFFLSSDRIAMLQFVPVVPCPIAGHH